MVQMMYEPFGNAKYKELVQARRQGGFEGVRANPPFDLQKILYTSILPFEGVPLVSLLLRNTAVQMSPVAATVPGV